MSGASDDGGTPRPSKSSDNDDFHQGLLTPPSPSQNFVLATPRTPLHNSETPFSQRMNTTPNAALPRGDIGRNFRLGNIPQLMNTPETPQNWLNSPTSNISTNNILPSQAFTPLNALAAEYSSNSSSISQSSLMPDLGNNEPISDVVFWGTTVNVDTCMNIFKNFIQEFISSESGHDFESYYHNQLRIIHRTQLTFLNLNCLHLREYPLSRKLYNQLTAYPQEVIPLMDYVINEEYKKIFGDGEGRRQIQVRPFGLQTVSRMRDLDPEHMDRLISIKGMVVRCSPIIPDLKQAYFRCFVCSASLDVLIDRGQINEPASCSACGRKGAMQLVHNRCLFTDKQLIRLQETPDEIPEGETPHTVSLFAFDELVDSVRPGDRIEITGIFRALPQRQNPRVRSLRSIYRTYIDVIHFRYADQSNEFVDKLLGRNGGDKEKNRDIRPQGAVTASSLEASKKTMFSEAKIVEFKKFAMKENVYEILTESFAPSIWELTDVKKGVLCQLFGGTPQTFPEQEEEDSGGDPPGSYNGMREDSFLNGRSDTSARNGNLSSSMHNSSGSRQHIASHLRSDINVLLCGDPGTSKSQLLSYVHKITPRGIYTSGKGSSAVGLTASVVRDPETKDMVLESGALVLSDNGICCIDEFDKMTDETRSILHEAMEQQTVSITKAGIIATLNARTSILASANPVDSRYNPNLSVVENIKLPPALLSRFDLIYLVLDKPNAENDRRLARHLVSLYHPDSSERSQRPDLISQEFLADYISYCRMYSAPEISDEAVETLLEGYLSMRALGGRGSKTITATPRQLESLIRLSQALAKMRLSTFVTSNDVSESFRLMKVATQAAATDPRTGTIDMDMITTGRTALDRDLILKLADELQLVFTSRVGQRLTVGQIRQILLKDKNSDVTVRMEDIVEACRELEASCATSSSSLNIQFTEKTQTILIRK